MATLTVALSYDPVKELRKDKGRDKNRERERERKIERETLTKLKPGCVIRAARSQLGLEQHRPATLRVLGTDRCGFP